MFTFGPASRGSFESDPNWGSVVALLQPTGADNSTAFVDLSGYAHSITVRGQAKQSAEQQVNGLNSIECDGNGDALRLAASSVFNVGSATDFTLEFFVRFNSVASRQIFLGFNGSLIAYFDMHRNTNSKLVWCDVGYQLELDQVLVSNTMYHIALCRSGTTLRGFVDGVVRFTQTSHNYTWQGNFVNGFEVGAAPAIAGDSLGLNGFIAQLRYTVGIARYTAGFAKPTAPFLAG